MDRDLFWITLILIVLAGGAGAQPGKTAGEAMKDVRVLKDVPVEEWTDTMRFISSSVGVGCEHCHMGEAYEKEDRKAKQTARAMILMTRELNAKNFDGRQTITCYTCHQGNIRPKASTTLWSKTPEAPATRVAETGTLPEAEQLIANYRKATGADGVRSLHFKLAVTSETRPAFEGEIYLGVPDRLHVHAKSGGADVRQVFAGNRGWVIAPGRTIEMSRENVSGVAKLVATFGPFKIQPAEGTRHTTGVEKIGERSYAVVESQSATHLERLYFDVQSGLLYKIYSETRTALGSTANETILEDYRDTGGVKMPFVITGRSATERTRNTISELQVNAPLDAALFEHPKEAANAK